VGDAGNRDGRGIVDAAGSPDARVCVGDFTITSQTDIDTISGCGSLTGGLLVESTDLVELRIPWITEIGGGLLINVNEQLTLVDMSGLRSVGDLFLTGSPVLTSVDFTELSSIGATLVIGPTPLTTLDGFGCLCGSGVTIEGNDQLLTLAGVGPIDATDVLILDNPMITGLPSISATNFLYIAGNDSLTSIPEWPITTLEQLNISRNATLDDITGFSMLSEVAASFEITDNAQLPNCQAEALRDQLAVVGTVTISGNDEVTPCP
jgi:hypothetical protein